MTWTMPIGAQADARGTHFRVWAMNAQRVEVVLYTGNQESATYDLQPEEEGYFVGFVEGVKPGTRYVYRLDGGDPRPDPASRFQPEGVHGPSEVVDPTTFTWNDGDWRGVALEELIIYEVHVGTATPEGTFDGLIGRLDAIKELGVTAVELMPVADFPGERNWGYDGVSLFAPSRAYGGPEGLRRLVQAAHDRGLAVILDVVYNHLGPDGNYLSQFSKAYFTDHHKTPWGDALNVDGPHNGPVRTFFLANADHWAVEYHIDGLRLDATHAILDDSPTHILTEIAQSVHELLPSDRHFLLIAENENNDPQLVRSIKDGGIGLDGVWADDFHHQVRVALANEHEGYYADYEGTATDLAATLQQGWFYVGQTSTALGHERGAPADDVEPSHFVYCIQNHDQIGNRALGERLNHDIALDAYRAASTLLLFSPYTPLLFMGQEWAASTPFLYFTDHNPELGRLVTEGRRAEFAGFTSFSGEQVPDPQATDTFEQSKLRWDEREEGDHAAVLRLYHDLIHLRCTLPALRQYDRKSFTTSSIGENALVLRRTGKNPEDTLLLIINLKDALNLSFNNGSTKTHAPEGFAWKLLLDSEDTAYGGHGSLASVKDQVLQSLELEGPKAVVLQASQEA